MPTTTVVLWFSCLVFLYRNGKACSDILENKTTTKNTEVPSVELWMKEMGSALASGKNPVLIWKRTKNDTVSFISRDCNWSWTGSVPQSLMWLNEFWLEIWEPVNNKRVSIFIGKQLLHPERPLREKEAITPKTAEKPRLQFENKPSDKKINKLIFLETRCHQI